MTVRDWLNYKGEGPWDFTAQPDKWGYLNNPRWTATPGPKVSYTGREDEEPQIWTPYDPSGVPTGSTEHIPCGHWHKREESAGEFEYDVNLFRVTDPWLDYGSVQSIHFDTDERTLSLVNYYISTPGVCGLEVVEDKVLTIQGRYDTAILLELDKDLNVLASNDIFNYYDCTGPRQYHIAYSDGNLYCSSSDSASGEPTKITKFTYPALTRQGRFTPGSVYTGSDGNLWAWMNQYNIGWGDADSYPVTGTPLLYNSFSDRIQDNEHDGPIVVFGDGRAQASTGGAGQSFSVLDGIVYVSAADTYAKIYAYNGSDYSQLAYVSPDTFGYAIYKSTKGFLYSASGLYDWFRIEQFTADLVLVNTTSLNGRSVGRVTNAYAICDIGNYIAVGTSSYGGSPCGLFLFDEDLNEIYFIEHTSSVQAISAYGPFLFVGENNHVSVYELVGAVLEFKDRLYVDFPDADVAFQTKWLKLMVTEK